MTSPPHPYPPAPPRWHTLHQSSQPNVDHIQVNITTDIPNFLTLAYTYTKPRIQARTLIRRGETSFHHYSYDLTNLNFVLQQQPGNVTNHTFQIPPQVGCFTLYYSAFDGTDAAHKHSVSPIFAIYYCFDPGFPNELLNFYNDIFPSNYNPGDLVIFVLAQDNTPPTLTMTSDPLTPLFQMTIQTEVVTRYVYGWWAGPLSQVPNFSTSAPTRTIMHAAPLFPITSAFLQVQNQVTQDSVVNIAAPKAVNITAQALNSQLANPLTAMLSGNDLLGPRYTVTSTTGFNYTGNLNLGDPYIYFAPFGPNAPEPGSQINTIGTLRHDATQPPTAIFRVGIYAYSIHLEISPNSPFPPHFTAFEDLSRTWRRNL